MKLVRAIVREERVAEIARVLADAGVDRLTVLRGFGSSQATCQGIRRCGTYPVFLPMCVIDVVASDAAADRVVSLVVDRDHPCTDGDDQVLVLTIDESAPIRAGLVTVP
jgi:nitrogen regulatory protein PII